MFVVADDVLERMASSLPKNGPLDIIDMYPGTSLWSSKVHDFVKPRRHILVEPNEKSYGKYLEPLLKQSGSRYAHVPWDPERTDILPELVNKGYLPEQGQRPSGPSTPLKCNDTLLLLANLTNARNRMKIKQRVLLKYIESALDRTGLHQYGLVRMIAILPTTKIELILPKHIGRRRKAQVTLEAITSDMKEVAGDTLEKGYVIRRGMLVMDESSTRTATRYDESRITTPPSRQPAALELAPDPEKSSFQNREYPRRPKHIWHDEYLEFLKKSRQGIKRAEQDGTPPPGKESSVYQRLVQLRKLYNLESKQIGLCYKADEKQAELDKLHSQLREIMIKNLPVPDEAEARELISSIQRLNGERDDFTSLLNKQYMQYHYPQHKDERRAFFQCDKPLLPHDRRPYEPLHVTADEFSPRTPCSIVDVHLDPNAPIFQPQHDQSEMGFAYKSTLEAFRNLLVLCTAYQKKPISDLLRQIFRDRPIPELLQVIPSLASLATPSISLNPDDTLLWFKVRRNQNVTIGYEDTCLDDVTMQRTPPTVFWEMVVEWEKWHRKTGGFLDNFPRLTATGMEDD